MGEGSSFLTDTDEELLSCLEDLCLSDLCFLGFPLYMLYTYYTFHNDIDTRWQDMVVNEIHSRPLYELVTHTLTHKHTQRDIHTYIHATYIQCPPPT